MEILLAGASAISLIIGGRFAMPLILKGFARDDIFYTLADENKGIVVVRGNEFERAILASSVYHLNEPGTPWYVAEIPDWEVLPNDGKDIPIGRDLEKEWAKMDFDARSRIAKSFGGYWVGVPWFYSLYRYKFVWNEMDLDDGGKKNIRHRSEQTKLWFAQDFTYIINLENVNTEEGLPISMLYSITVRITNPLKALFQIADWLLLVQSVTDPIVRQFAATHTWEALRKAGGSDNEAKKFNDLVCAISNVFPEDDESDSPYERGTRGRYGVTIIKANFQDPELTGDAAAKNEEAATAKFIATAERDAEVLQSEGRATAAKNVGFAEADVIARKGEAEAKAMELVLGAAAKEPELARVRIQAQAIASPGDGKVLIDVGGLLDKAGRAFTRKGG